MARAEINLIVIAGSAATLALSWAIIAAADTQGGDVAPQEVSAVDISTPPAAPVDLVSATLDGPVSAPLPVFDVESSTASDFELSVTEPTDTNTASAITTEPDASPTPAPVDDTTAATTDPQTPVPSSAADETTTDPSTDTTTGQQSEEQTTEIPLVEAEPEIAPAPEPTPEEDVVRNSKAS